MKDSEFIELLNLYLDHEISAADAARLEAEVQHNPARREIYRQYCQMQKACSMLASDYAAAPVESKKVVSFEPRRSRWQPVLWSATGLAAAACAAFFLFNRPGNRTPEGATPIAQYAVPVVEPLTPPPASDSRAIARTVTTANRAADLQPALSAKAFTLTNTQGTVALTPEQFDWMRNVQLTPLQQTPAVEELLRFETQPAALKAGPATYRSGRPLQMQAEFVGFEFKK